MAGSIMLCNGGLRRFFTVDVLPKRFQIEITTHPVQWSKQIYLKFNSCTERLKFDKQAQQGLNWRSIGDGDIRIKNLLKLTDEPKRFYLRMVDSR